MNLQAGGNSSVLVIDLGTPSPVQDFLVLNQNVQISSLSSPLLGSYFLLSSDGPVSISIAALFLFQFYWLQNQQLTLGDGL